MGELATKRVVITRAQQDLDELGEALRAVGAEIIEHPTIQILPPDDYAPLDQAIAEISSYALIIVGSKNAVQALSDRAKMMGKVITCPVACIGDKTEAFLETKEAFRGEVIVPPEYRGESLLEMVLDRFGDSIAGCRFLFPRAPEGRDTILRGLLAKGAEVDAVVAYRIAPAPPPTLEAQQRLEQADVFTFLSGVTLQNFVESMPSAAVLLAAKTVAVIGPVAREKADQLGIRVDVMPPKPGIDTLVEALVKHFSR